jgi:hypothetical protein
MLAEASPVGERSCGDFAGGTVRLALTGALAVAPDELAAETTK